MRSLVILLLSLFSYTAVQSQSLHADHDPYEVRIVDKSHLQVDASLQYQLRHAIPWATFREAHPGWAAQFDEDNFKPLRAFGPGIPMQGADAEARAQQFIDSELGLFGIPMDQLEVRTTTDNGKHHQVFYTQTYEGLEVMYAQAMVKMLHDGRVISWSAVVHSDIELNTTPLITEAEAMTAASADMESVEEVTLMDGLKVLPIPGVQKYEHHLVYEVEVECMRASGLPGHYIVQVDAHTGAVLQRINQVHTFHGPEDEKKSVQQEQLPLPVNAQFSAVIPYPDPSEAFVAQLFSEMRVLVGGNNNFTDETGSIALTDAGPLNAQVFMSGTWASVFNEINNSVSSTVVTLEEGDNMVDLTNEFQEDELAAFFSTNVIHDYVNHVMPDFDGMDYPMTVNVSITPHDCNAFSTGNSINFFVGGADCVSLATVADVVFHEYGHEINNNYYADFGVLYSNGAMNEGYADVWAFLPIEDPILADGHNPQDPEDYIRRYDMDPKVYPQDIVGEVHADGEIIAGAWWDTFVLLGNDIAVIEELWRLHYTGLQATVSNGNEGAAYLNVLLDVLEADDDDGNLLNGTPHGAAISEGFAIHGITFLATAELDHEVVEFAEGQTPLVINTELDLSADFTSYLGGLTMNYRMSNSDVWTEVDMVELGDGSYEATIPAQPAGTIVAYYIGVNDIYGNIAVVDPVGANLEDPKLPHFTLVGYQQEEVYNSDDEDDVSGWELGDDDEATTGEWEEVAPVGSFLNGIPVAVNVQATPDGEFCWVTGNSFDPNDGIGTNDVDGGTTTLISEEIDLTDYVAPAFTYMRWYTNATGANPNADWWQVQVSDDGGASWVYVEDTKSSDARWRRNAFRITDYVSITDEFMIKFNASDSLRPGTNLDGGSLIEAGLDDFIIYDRSIVDNVDENDLFASVELYPNPSSTWLQIDLQLIQKEEVEFIVRTVDGRLVMREDMGTRTGPLRHQIDVETWAAGQYQLEVRTSSGSAVRNFSVE